jgi:hypothetical protein
MILGGWPTFAEAIINEDAPSLRLLQRWAAVLPGQQALGSAMQFDRRPGTERLAHFVKVKIFSHWLYRGPPFENRERWGILIYDCSGKGGASSFMIGPAKVGQSPLG